MEYSSMSKKTTIMPATLCYIAFTCLLLSTSSYGAVDNLKVPLNVGCVCPGDELTFICTIIGGGNTIWRGTAFDCQSSSNEIILRHSQFEDPGAVGSCTSAMLRARSLDVENGNCFVSELNATVMASFNNQTIGCYHNSMSGTRLINESVLSVVSVANPSPPQNLNLTSINEEQVLFSWTALSPPCSFVEYTYIITSDCGVCPPSTDASTVTCTGFQLPTDSNDTECRFTINSRLCDITGDVSTEVLLRVPNVPSIENVIPSYLNDTKELRRLMISVAKNETEANMNDVSGAISTYNLLLSTSAAGPTRSISIDADSGSCDENTCTYTADVPQDVCMSPSNLSTALSAKNRIGQGFPSDVTIIGCTNEFVRLYYNATTSIFTCVFTNGMDNSEKSCNISLARDGQDAVQRKSTNTNSSVVSLNIGDIADGMYSFVVLASSGVTTVQVEGDFRKGAVGNNNVAIIVGIVVAVVVVVSTLSAAIILYITCRRRKSLDLRRYRHFSMVSKGSLQLRRLPKTREINFTAYKVDHSRALRDGMMGKKDWKGHVYYELTDNQKEDIPDDREILLIEMSKESKSKETHGPRVNTSGHEGTSVDLLSEIKLPDLFTFGPDVTPKILRDKNLIGEGITRQAFVDKYRVFVQSKGSGSRHLAKDTWVLYEKGQTPSQNSRTSPSSVPKDYFVTEKVDKKVTLQEFWDAHGLQRNKLNIFLELTASTANIKIRDVLLMDKNTGELFNHPTSLRKVKDKKLEEIDPKWRVLVVGEYRKDSNVVLEPSMWVAYENPKFVYGSKVRALEVKEDNVRLSDFISKSAEIGTFERGKAFYEFIEGDVEDLVYFRKAMAVTDKVVKQLLKEDSSAPSITWVPEATVAKFYDIHPNVPGEGIMAPTSNIRLFIQSMSQGARCLKKGTVVLYICGRDDSKKHGANADLEKEEDGKIPVGLPSTDATPELLTAQNGKGKEKTTKIKVTGQ